MQTKRCTCGALNPLQAKKCGNCGANISSKRGCLMMIIAIGIVVGWYLLKELGYFAK
jgi:hypothetical protein